MKSQKGSVTVIALIMLLFLVIIGGAWTIMMTQEKTNAFADEKQQQAWYAAEAGYKRAAILLTRTSTDWNSDWSWTTYDDDKWKDGSSNGKTADLTKVDLATTSILSSDSDILNKPWYSVHINLKSGTTVGDSIGKTYAHPSSTQIFTITSIGQYMGERKIITRDVTLTVTGSATTPTKKPSVAGLIGVVNANILDMQNSGGPSNLDRSSKFYVNKLIYNGYGSYGDGTSESSLFQDQSGNANYLSSLFSEIPESYFVDKATVKKAGAVHYTTKYGNDPQVTLEANKVYYIDSSSVINWDGSVNNNNSIENLIGASGATIYVYDDMVKRIGKVTGVTTAGSVPTTLIVNNSSVVSLNFEAAGRVRMLFANSVIFSGGNKYNNNCYFMAMTNGYMQYIGQHTYCAFLSANDSYYDNTYKEDISVLVSGGNFTGQVMTPYTVKIVGQNTKLDDYILHEKDSSGNYTKAFWLDSWK